MCYMTNELHVDLIQSEYHVDYPIGKADPILLRELAIPGCGLDGYAVDNKL